MRTKTIRDRSKALTLRTAPGNSTQSGPLHNPNQMRTTKHTSRTLDETHTSGIFHGIRDLERQLSELEDLSDASANWHLYERPTVKRQIVVYRPEPANRGRESCPMSNRDELADEQRLQRLNQEIQALRDQLVDLIGTAERADDLDWYERAELKHLIIIREDERTTLVNSHDARMRREAAARICAYEASRTNGETQMESRSQPPTVATANGKGQFATRVRRKFERARPTLFRELAKRAISLWLMVTSRKRRRQRPQRRTKHRSQR